MIFVYLPHLYVTRPEMYTPLGIMIIAALMEKKGYDIDIKNYSHFSFEEAIEDLPKTDIYGITCTSLELPDANKFSRLIKKKYPQSTIFLGGPGTITEEYVDWNVVDSIVKGEAETTFFDMLDDKAKGLVDPIYYGKPVDDLDSLPLPARHLLKDNLGCNIFSWDTGDNKSTVLMTSRGCPHNCAFCASRHLLQENVRYRSIDKVIEEIKHCKETYGIRQFRLTDEMINANRERFLEFCDKIESLEVNWRCTLRVRPLDMDMLKAMRDSGCLEISFGIESFDQDVLDMLNKKTTPQSNARALILARDAGLKTRVFILLRTPGQTKQTISKNIQYLNIVPFDVITCSTLIPFPGTDIWFHPKKYGVEIINRNLEDYNMWSFSPEGEREWPDIIRPLDRDVKEWNNEADIFKEYLLSTGKWNRG